ncbi:MAG: hypothetical protein LQ338_004885 [Usnochroma carphineum]|nr:MAG: hypothetical protein LQ338_004885 [Usnochroma carphineum]
MDNFHSAAQSWSYRVPSPPRLLVPPPPQDRRGAPALRIVQSPGHSFDSSGFPDTEFLNTVSYGDCITGHAIYDWKYENRWTAQRILPFLFLGPVTAARSRDFLQQNGITMLLAVRDTKSAHARLLGSKAAQELNIPYFTVDTAGNQELIAAFPHGIEIINAHLSAMYQHSQNNSDSDKASALGRVLVFCETGNERSAAMVVAYMMAMFSIDVIKAIQIVQAQRFAVALNDATKLLLQSYDAILSAKRDVLRTALQDSGHQPSLGLAAPVFPQGNVGMSRQPGKRTLDHAYDDDMDYDEGGVMSDGVTPERRQGASPFRDDAGI